MDQPGSGAVQQVPASGPTLLPAVQQARQHLDKLQPVLEPKDVGHRVWSRLLELTEKLCSESGTAVVLRRSDVDVALGIELTGRVWSQQVIPWYELRVRESLAAIASVTGIPALEPGRLSDRSGGRPEYSQAQYFVAFSGVHAAQVKEGAKRNDRDTRKEPKDAESASSSSRNESTADDRTESVHLTQTVQLAFLASQETRTTGDAWLVVPVLAAFFALLSYLAFVASTTNQTISALVDSLQRLASLVERIFGPWLT